MIERNIVLYAGSCSACSSVARLVTNASIAGLESRSFDDPQVGESLAGAGLEIPSRPALLVLHGGDAQLVTGWAMRRKLAAIVGWRRSGTIVRLLAAEWRVRIMKTAGSHAPSRRGVIGGSLLGIVGWAMSAGVAHASATTPAANIPTLRAVSSTVAAKVLRTATAQRAASTWGAAEVLQVAGGSNPAFVLHHSERDVYTFIDNSSHARQTGAPFAISLGMSSAGGRVLTIRYYNVSGAALADLTVADGQTTVTAVTSVHTDVAVAPDFNLSCFRECIGRYATATCGNSCGVCALSGNVLPCTTCVACAGTFGIVCGKECR